MVKAGEHSLDSASGDSHVSTVANPRRTRVDADGRPAPAQSVCLPQQD
jgi:hypothetical protein